VRVSREGTFLRCTANTEALQELLTSVRRMLYPEYKPSNPKDLPDLPIGEII